MTIDGVDANKFKTDKQQCYKQVQTDAATPMSDYYNVIKFRDCLVNSLCVDELTIMGYRHLGWTVII
jgi:hypothetical protein